jgi:hypothetical protein
MACRIRRLEDQDSVTCGAPIGAVVRLYVDMLAALEPGDVLSTPAGTHYAVVSARRGRGPVHPHRQYLEALKVEVPAAGARVVILRWYRRKRRSARSVLLK